jgi:hypothetical protein
VRLATSPDFLQSVMERVYGWVAQDDEIDADLSALFPTCLFLEFETGGFVVQPLGGGRWEVHTLFLPGSRDVAACGAEAADFVFNHTDAQLVVTRVPVDNRAADRLTRRMGFAYTHTEPAAFLRKGVRHDVKHYALSRAAWQNRER